MCNFNTKHNYTFMAKIPKKRPTKLLAEQRYELYVKENGKEPPKYLVEYWKKNEGKLNLNSVDSLEARMAKSKGGKKARLKERVSLLLDLDAGELPPSMLPEDVDEKMKTWSIETLMSVKQIQKAIQGDTNAYKEIMDRGRGKAVQKVEQTLDTNVNIKPISWATESKEVEEAEVVKDEDENDDN